VKRPPAALVDEARCIGCTRCIDVCPVDAIVGAQGLMHSVVEPWCIGCALCPPACPVDCIDMVPRQSAWSESHRRAAGMRGRKRKARLERQKVVPVSGDRAAVLQSILGKKR
jgi:Na+-translocating ferredoxin:NAD+ oxidoreductase subunit B